MKKRKMLIAAVGIVLTAACPAYAQEQEIEINCQELAPLSPTYLDGALVDAGWDSNWFIMLQGGASAFIGNPVGHADLFDRFSPMLHASLGKWFTPHFGGRLSYQGLKLKDWQLESRAYQSVHADFLYNVSSHFRNDIDALPRWDCIPYAGVGIIRNSHTHRKPFAISYGIIGRYRLNSRLHLSAELGATNTFRDFDGKGEGNKLGDQLLQASLGMTVTIGKVGWKRVIDAKPYICQNDIMASYVDYLQEKNQKLSKQHEYDMEALAELNKILEIEGLLGKYRLTGQDVTTDEDQYKAYPRNDYSGLNSLRKRIRNRGWDGNPDNYKPMLSDSTEYNGNKNMSVPGLERDRDMAAIGSPIFFFFRLNSCEMTEKAQVINIDELAKVAKKNGLLIEITGAADSQTGDEKTNEMLSARRADYMAKMLRERGIPDDNIMVRHEGGINRYAPFTANRNTRVVLYIRK
ncbi:MAG: OmpA family protein [Prevotella sp.]|nr:OmpA family protein [Prevotella sp.]